MKYLDPKAYLTFKKIFGNHPKRLRTEFKRIWPYGHWASAFAFQL